MKKFLMVYSFIQNTFYFYDQIPHLTNTGTGQTTLYALCCGPFGPVSLLQRMIGILGQGRHHSMQWPLWACEPPAEDDT